MPRRPRSGPRAVRAARRARAGFRAQVSYREATALKNWRARVEGCLSFLERLASSSVDKESKWTTGSIRHYHEHIKLALQETPSGGEPDAKRYRDRLKAIGLS